MEKTASDEEMADRVELESVIQRMTSRQRRMDRRDSQAVNFGPSFNLTFTHESDSDSSDR